MSFVTSNLPFFGPKQVPGLALWLDASDATSVVLSPSTQNVTRWNDKSGNIYNATAFGTGSPTYSSNSIIFTGNQAFSTTLPSLMSNQSGFAIVKYSSAAKINILSLTRTSGTAGIQQIIENNLQRTTTYGNNPIVSGATLTQNTILLYNHTFSATTNAFLYVNGSQTGTSTGPYTFTGAGTINIGGYDAGPGEGFVGSMYEILLYSNVLTTSQRQQVEGHLAWKWGLQSNLPVGHPYRFNSQQATYPFITIQTPFINVIKPYYSEFSPRSISGCRLWLDAADASTITLSNNAVTQWTDKSGNSNNATQPTVGSQPLYSNSFVFLNGTTQFFNVNLDFLASVSHNFFIVLRNFNYTNIYGAANGSLGANSLHIGFTNSTAYRMNHWGNDWYPNITANYKVNQTNLLNFNWVNNSSKIIYANGSLEGSNPQPGVIGTMSGGGRIGNVVGQGFINANIYEILIYTGTLTISQRQQIEGYLSSKWGILSNLALTNPYSGNMRKFIYSTIDISRPLVHSVSRNTVKWVPTQISGCALWLDAADRASITLTGSNITNVNDKSGQNVVLSNATGFSYRTNLFNGSYPSFYNPNGGFASGTTARLGVNASFAVSVPFTVFFVGHDITTTSDYGYVIDSGPSGAFSNRPYLYNGSLITQFGNTGTTLTARSPFQGCAQFYNSATMRINSSSVYTGSLATFTIPGITIGNRLSLNEAWPGHLCEILIYNKSITTKERQQVEGYLAYKWGLRSLLPANHPYKNIPVS
uniref:Lectin/glucanase superfamily protein n=1 Tax=viral metagenome TaxID=1070528 RepID=A0A6C0IAR1_9ZZZZ